jgi:single-strand DNA-binding protein
MADTTITGNLAGDPILRRTGTGKAVASFSVAENRRRFDAATGKWLDDATLFVRCTAWGDLAENLHDSARKGQRVTVSGRLVPTEYTKDDGTVVRGIELVAEDVALSLRFSKATFLDGAPADASALATSAAPY